MSWLSNNLTIIGTPVDGIATIKVALPGTDTTDPANFRQTVANLETLEELPVPPPPTHDEFDPILRSVKW